MGVDVIVRAEDVDAVAAPGRDVDAGAAVDGEGDGGVAGGVGEGAGEGGGGLVLGGDFVGGVLLRGG